MQVSVMAYLGQYCVEDCFCFSFSLVVFSLFLSKWLNLSVVKLFL